MKKINLFKLLALLVVLIASINTAWAWTATFRCVPALTFGANWSSGNTCKVFFNADYGWGDATSVMSPTGLMYESGGNLYEIYSVTRSDLPGDGVRNVHFERWDGSSWKENQGQYNDWKNCAFWDGEMHYGSWGSYTYKTFNISASTTIYFDNSDLNCTNVRLYFFKDGWDQDASDNNFTQIAGTPYWYKTYTEAWNGYAGLVFKNQGNWDKKSGNIYQDISGTSTCFTPTSGDNGASLSTTAPVGPKNIAISNTASVVRGSGTEGSPYVVAPGTSLTQSVSAATIDASTTLYYMFSAGSATSYSSSTTTNTRIASAVAGTSYNVYATVKTMKSSNSSRAFNSSTLYYTTAYAVTLNDNGGSGGDGTSYAVNGASAVALTNLPTKASKGFDGYWTGSGGTGTQVIDENGNWISGVTGYTDGSGNWTCTGGYTLYARWLDTGYYIIINDSVAGTNNFLSGSPLKKGIYIDKTGYASGYSGTYTGALKIRKITTTPGSDVWYGKSASIGKGTPTASSLSYNNNKNSVTAITLQVYYTGTYTFEFNPSSPSVTVAVPVIDQLQIYSPTDGCQGNYAWGPAVSNIVTKTVALKASTTYTFKAVYDSEFWSKTNGSITRNSTSVTGITHTGGEGNLSITTDVAGDYTFELDMTSSSEKVTVTYPDKYTVTYGRSPSAAASAPTLDKTLVDGYIADGTTLTFTRGTINSGYTWKGWYDNSSGTGDALGTDNTCSVTMDGGNVTVYAVYTEDKHSVTVAKDPSAGGTTNVTSVSGVGIATASSSITATANTGYYFSGWDLESGLTQASLSTSNSQASSTSTITINATADSKTITADFGVRYAIYGSFASEDTGDGMPGWTTPRAFDSYDSEGKEYTLEWTALKPNSRYKLKVLDRRDGHSYGPTGDTDIPDGTQWTLNGTVDEGYALYFSTKGRGTYTLTSTTTGDAPSQKPTAKIDMPTSYTVTYGQVTNNGQNGGSISSVKDDGNYDLSSGGYVAAAGSATFTAGTPTTGYRFVDWRTSSTYGQGTQLSTDNPWTLSSPDGNKTVYAHYAENMCTVTITANDKTKGSITVAGEDFSWDGTTSVGVYSTKALVVTPEDGYYFSGWTLSTSPDFAVGDATEDGASTTLRGLGGTNGSTGTLTANFVELEKIYFRNWNEGTSAPLWSVVYVYFSISTEKSGDDDCAKSNVSTDYYTEMTQIGTTNVYWAYVPRGTTKHSDRRIAFSNHDFGTNYKFLNYEASMRNDYDKTLNMFVPYRTVKSTKNGTKYYDDGFWKAYGNIGEKSGYYIDRWDFTESKYKNPASKGTGDDWQFVITGDNTIEYELRIDNPDNTYNSYAIASLVGTKYNTSNSSQTGTAITMANCESGVQLHDYQNNPRFSINPTSQGIYTITIDQSSDKMKIYVNYPVMLNDYRIKHTYTIDAKKDSAYSDVIKNSAAGSGVTASMYINTINSPTLTLEKCTDVSTNPVKWTKQGDDLWSTLGGNFDKGKGVYKFDVTINTSTNTITGIDHCGIYDGEFYIKTDIGSGGWTAYKANVMEKNTLTFNKDDSKTFDRSYCHWVGSTSTNIKCVIANDYNIAVSDTLEGDAIIGAGNQTLPSAAHVRFSYNSTTNELKRTYLAVSGDDHLIMEGNTLSSGTVFMIHDNTADQGAAFTNNKATLENQSNFTFGLDIKARETARVRLSAKYNNVVQYLVGNAGTLEGESNANTVEIMGGSSSVPGYNNIRISYDFKTNQLLSAWLPPTSGNTTPKAINADVMIIREEQGDARQITFANSNEAISKVDTVYGVMKFNKYSLNNRNKTNTADSVRSAYARDLYWISFPFDVKLSDAFGMGTYGTHWIIERYDGKGRAKNGFWADSEPNWKFVTPYMRDTGFVMKANEGYILALDLVELGYSSLVWDNNMTEAYLYFPSQNTVGNIKKTDVTVKVDTVGYTCTINRGTPDGNRTIKDSHWHCIGAPSFANVSHAATTNWKDADVDYPNVENWKTNTLLFVYDWNSEYNTLTPVSAASHNFKAMHAYMVQYSQPTISWTSASTPAASVAARLADTPDREYQLALLREDEEQDHTYVRLSDNENVTAGFEFNYDLSKELNKNRGNIWTVTTDGTQVAGNSMPHPLATTIVPVGVKIATAGEYTFTMPEGTNGGDVWLLDNQTNSRTNLGLMDYTVNLTAGTIDGRFSLEFGPIQDAPTGIDEMSTVNSQLSTDSVRKVFVGGRLYIIRDGKAYDATGAQVR